MFLEFCSVEVVAMIQPRKKARRFVLCLCFIYSLVSTAHAQVSSVALVAVVAGLQELKQTLQSSIGTVDGETANRINQLSLAVDKTIAEVKTAIQDTSNQVQFDENKVFSDVFSTMSQINSEIDNKGYLAFIGVNSSLANVATTMEGIPLIKVKNYLYATYPLRIGVKATDRLVRFFGHFPDVDDKHPATATYSIDGLPEQKVSLSRNVGGSLSLTIPNGYLKEASFINFSISIPKKSFLSIYGSDTFTTRVYVETLKALTFSVESFQANPNLWANVPAPAAHVERADSNRTTNIGSMSAPQLFSVLMNNNTTYDASSATFASMSNIPPEASGSPCWCGCSPASAATPVWDSNTVSWSLSAPTCGYHYCTKGGGRFGIQTQSCGGGGTHAQVTLQPVFRVKVRGQPEQAPINSTTFALARNDVWTSSSLPPTWSTITVKGVFKDGDETNTCQLTVSKGVPNGTCPLFKADVIVNAITIQSF